MDLYDCRLVIRFTPGRPHLRVIEGVDGPAGESTIGAELAANAFFRWVTAPNGAVLGVELMIGPDLEIFEAHPGALRLPYFDGGAAFPVVWFTERRDGEASGEEDYLSQ